MQHAPLLSLPFACLPSYLCLALRLHFPFLPALLHCRDKTFYAVPPYMPHTCCTATHTASTLLPFLFVDLMDIFERLILGGRTGERWWRGGGLEDRPWMCLVVLCACMLWLPFCGRQASPSVPCGMFRLSLFSHYFSLLPPSLYMPLCG